MAFTKTPSNSKQWKYQSAPEDTGKQFTYTNSKSPISPSNKRKSSIIALLILFSLFFLTLVLLSYHSKPVSIIAPTELQNPIWFDTIEKEFRGRRKIKVGVVNINEEKISETLKLLGLSEKSDRSRRTITETVSVGFDRVDENEVRWESLFPEWNDEKDEWKRPKCPEIPMPNKTEMYGDLDVIVAKLPCEMNRTVKRGMKNVLRLQVNLVVASVALASGWVEEDSHRTVYVVFVGSCGAMGEIFRCDDMVMEDEIRAGEGIWVYKPEMNRLKQKVLMPVGSCQLAPLYAQTGKEEWRKFMTYSKLGNNNSSEQITTGRNKSREAYVTILHSSEAYVCGAIALAQSIILTNSSKDLVILVDDSITPKSRHGLRAAGWKIHRIERIRSPFAEKDSYNEWNYSKLRVWQLVKYDKIIFIDADLLVLKNIDKFFALPQLSAVINNKVRFNSGMMVLEPSACMFENLMSKSFELESYNGGDQGFLNEVFTWWHRLPSRINHLKIHEKNNNEITGELPYAIHYLGLKPWACYRDYDCNWDNATRHVFASDAAHAKWWEIYDKMPSELQGFCGLTKEMDARIKKWRRIAKNLNLADGHWKIEPKDPRQYNLIIN